MGPVQEGGVTEGGSGFGRRMTAHGGWSVTPSTVDSAGTAQSQHIMLAADS